jgi:hypothetical protein
MRFGYGRAAATLIVVACVALAACGSDENLEPVLDTSPTEPPPPTTTTLPNPDKPVVSIPAELPTELVVTDLTRELVSRQSGDPSPSATSGALGGRD